MKHISQREARRLQKRVRTLEDTVNKQRASWAQEWPGGVHIGTIDCATQNYDTKVIVARKLGHAVVLVNLHVNKLEMYALPLPGAA